MEICKVNIEDAAELLAIYAPYVQNTAVSFEYEIPTLEEFEGRIKAISEAFPYIKAVENGKIIGYAYANTFHLRAAYQWNVETTIYLREDARQKGVGKKLYLKLEEACKNMGILNMNACIATTDIEDEHLTNASVYFHEKMGYRMVGKFHNSGYKFGKWYDMVWMEKEIASHRENQESPTIGNWTI